MLRRIIRRVEKDNGAKKKPKGKLKRGGVREIPSFTPCGSALGALLSAHDRRKEKLRVGGGDWIHVSSLVNGDCLRANALARMEGFKGEDKPRHADRLLWAIGKAVEKHIRTSMIDLFGPDNCVGLWSCACGKESHKGFGRFDPDRCANCGTLKSSHYDEFHVVDEDHLLSGSIDFVVKPEDDPRLTVVEIKSIKVVPKGGVRNSTPEFHTIESPQRGHALQALLYRKLLELNHHIVSNEVLVAYGAKDYVMESPYKIFEVDATAEENVMAVDNLMAMAKEYADKFREGKLMPRLPACSSCNTSRAKACPMAAACFSRKK